jgi:4-amino-4-deoxy-L-arabinose transferase-like glycosyltransferase
MQKLTINKRSLLRILLGVYLFPLYLVCFSLSVPPADLPLCGLMFVMAAFGLILARRESRAWRVVWTIALIVSILFGVLEIIAGQHMARQRSKPDSSMRLTMPGIRSPDKALPIDFIL